MTAERIPRGSQAKALGYFQQLYKSRIMYNEAEIISSMPPAMRNVFAMHIYEKFLKTARHSAHTHTLCRHGRLSASCVTSARTHTLCRRHRGWP